MIVSVLTLALLVLIAYVASHRLGGMQVLLVFVLGAIGIVLVAVPNLTTLAASALGVGRGTDLLLYLSLVAGLFIASHFFFRFKRQEKQFIALIRHLALLEAQIGDEPRARLVLGAEATAEL